MTTETKYSSKDLEKAIRIAKEAGAIQLKYFKTDFKVRYKTGKYDPVTIADTESDVHIRKRLKQEFPDDKILSEENPEIVEDYCGRVWIVDPLDGTKEFVSGSGRFSVMIGLCVDAKPVLGVVYIPITGEIYYAQKSFGAFYENPRNDSRRVELHVSKVKSLADSRFITRIPHDKDRPLDPFIDGLETKEKIMDGSTGIKMSRIAAGEGDAHVHTNYLANKWDTCGPQVILEEAGGKITDLLGNNLDYTQTSSHWEYSFMATNGVLHAPLLNELKSFFKTNHQKPFK